MEDADRAKVAVEERVARAKRQRDEVHADALRIAARVSHHPSEIQARQHLCIRIRMPLSGVCLTDQSVQDLTVEMLLVTLVSMETFHVPSTLSHHIRF